jgi:rSAM/selenodomain-associated transferase 2
MKNFLFNLWCLLWLADIITLAALGPVGKQVLGFSVFYCLGHILMVLMVLRFPSDLTGRTSLTIIFTLGVAARLVFLAYPVGNDAFRYVWEGYIQQFGFNPYLVSPTSPALGDIARGQFYPLWQQINHPDYAAAYPPFILLLFRVLAGLNPSPFFFKAVMAVCDIGVMIILTLMINRLAINPSRLLLYAANPLVLVYVAGEGHLDVIQLFFLFLALYLVICKNHSFSGFLMLGLAAMSKYLALLALPFLINYQNRWKSPAVFIPLILYAPFMDAGAGIFQSLAAFAHNFHYNDSISVLIRLIFGDRHLLLAVFLLMICLAWIYLFVHNRLRSVYLVLGCLLLLLPTLHPWYLILIAPFLVFFPSQAWLYLMAAVVFTFPVIAIESNTGVFQEIPWLKIFEYVPFYGLLIWGIRRDGYLKRDQVYARPERISAIIPTLNEENNLVRCLNSLRNRTALNEIIVADGGSTDATGKLAVEQGARLVTSPKGRGIQIQNGIKAASGDVIMILHADCRAKKGVFKKVVDTLETSPDIVGGAFGMQFEPQDYRTRIIAFLNNLRTILTGISFGDQAQFFRRDALDRMGGFPALMLMEDVELSLRLKETGRLVFIPEGIVVSGRRWQDKRLSGNLATVFYLFTRYLIERRWGRVNHSMREYYEIYYSGRNGL